MLTTAETSVTVAVVVTDAVGEPTLLTVKSVGSTFCTRSLKVARNTSVSAPVGDVAGLKRSKEVVDGAAVLSSVYTSSVVGSPSGNETPLITLAIFCPFAWVQWYIRVYL